MTYTIDLKPRAEREAMIAKRLEASNEFGETIYDFRSGSFTPPRKTGEKRCERLLRFFLRLTV